MTMEIVNLIATTGQSGAAEPGSQAETADTGFEAALQQQRTAGHDHVAQDQAQSRADTRQVHAGKTGAAPGKHRTDGHGQSQTPSTDSTETKEPATDGAVPTITAAGPYTPRPDSARPGTVVPTAHDTAGRGQASATDPQSRSARLVNLLTGMNAQQRFMYAATAQPTGPETAGPDLLAGVRFRNGHVHTVAAGTSLAARTAAAGSSIAMYTGIPAAAQPPQSLSTSAGEPAFDWSNHAHLPHGAGQRGELSAAIRQHLIPGHIPIAADGKAPTLESTPLFASAATSAPAVATTPATAPAGPTPAPSAPVFTGQLNAPVGSEGWSQALRQQTLRLSHFGNGRAELTLYPRELGRIQVSMKMGDHAQLHFATPNAGVRTAVEAALPQLRQAFADNGLSLGQASVSDQGSPQSGTGQPKPHSGHGGFGGLDDERPAAPVAITAIAGRAADGGIDIFA